MDKHEIKIPPRSQPDGPLVSFMALPARLPLEAKQGLKLIAKYAGPEALDAYTDHLRETIGTPYTRRTYLPYMKVLDIETTAG